MTHEDDPVQEAGYLAGLMATLRGPVKLDCEHVGKPGHQLTWRCDHCQPLTPDEKRYADRHGFRG